MYGGVGGNPEQSGSLSRSTLLSAVFVRSISRDNTAAPENEDSRKSHQADNANEYTKKEMGVRSNITSVAKPKPDSRNSDTDSRKNVKSADARQKTCKWYRGKQPQREPGLSGTR